MRPLALFISVLVVATACASNPPTKTAWAKPGADSEELEVARKACLSDPGDLQTQETSEWLNARLAGNRFVGCMEKRGWKRVSAP